jgi:Flp pilus assembly protein TadB
MHTVAHPHVRLHGRRHVGEQHPWQRRWRQVRKRVRRLHAVAQPLSAIHCHHRPLLLLLLLMVLLLLVVVLVAMLVVVLLWWRPLLLVGQVGVQARVTTVHAMVRLRARVRRLRSQGRSRHHLLVEVQALRRVSRV